MEEQKTEAKSVMSYFIGLETPGKRTICFETKNISLERALERLEKKSFDYRAKFCQRWL